MGAMKTETSLDTYTSIVTLDKYVQYTNQSQWYLPRVSQYSNHCTNVLV